MRLTQRMWIVSRQISQFNVCFVVAQLFIWALPFIFSSAPVDEWQTKTHQAFGAVLWWRNDLASERTADAPFSGWQWWGLMHYCGFPLKLAGKMIWASAFCRWRVSHSVESNAFSLWLLCEVVQQRGAICSSIQRLPCNWTGTHEWFYKGCRCHDCPSKGYSNHWMRSELKYSFYRVVIMYCI